MHDELSVFRTALGWGALLGGGGVLRALTFGHRSPALAARRLRQDNAVIARRSVANCELALRIRAVLEGEPDELRDVAIDTGHLTPFARRVVNACRRIPWGQTASYADLAEAADSPAAARAVGQVMAANRTPLVVPCHRVVGSGGSLGGYSGPSGLALKRRLLALEASVLCG